MKRNPQMLGKAVAIRGLRRILPLFLAMTIGLIATGCSLPGFADDSAPDQPVTEQQDPDGQQLEPIDDPSPDQQQNPDEATDSDDRNNPLSESTPERIVEAGVQEPRTLNPVLVGDPLSEEISQLVFSGLVMLDPETAEPLPDLAESWEISDDGTTYRFDLRDVSWHDGQPLTAGDVVFTYELMMNEQTRSPRYSRLVERITAVEAIDNDTVEFRLAGPYTPFLSTLATFGIVPQHILVDVLPSELVTDPFGISSAIGTGPFMLNRWDRGERILLDSNPDYHHSPPVFDQYEYRVVAGESDILEGLGHGSIDWARISAAQFEEAADLRDVRVESIPSFEVVSIVLQLDPGKSTLFEDPKVREALMLALDREAIAEEIWHGHAEVAHGTLPPASWAYRRSDARYDYDPERAAELLTEAGWATSDDGIRMKDGIPLQFGIVANGDNPVRRVLTQALVESWREIGIGAHTQFERWGAVRDNITTSREFDALVLGFRWDVDPNQHAMWSSDSMPDAFNLGGYVNLDVDRLLDQGATATDPDDRAEIYAEMQDLVMSDLPALPIVYPNLIVAFGPRLQDVDPTAILVRNRATIAEWVPVIANQGEAEE